jgi:hypothetical protein
MQTAERLRLLCKKGTGRIRKNAIQYNILQIEAHVRNSLPGKSARVKGLAMTGRSARVFLGSKKTC